MAYPRYSHNDPNVLSSDWTGLSNALLASIYPVRKMADGSGWEVGRKTDSTISDQYVADGSLVVRAPMSDGTSELTLNWTSPFENAGAESMVGTLSAMLQSGTLTSILQGVGGAGVMPDAMSDLAKKSAELSRKIEGKTGITKLNSTQIFSGMPPGRVIFTLHFRAIRDAIREVREPILKLKEWSLSQYLAPDGFLAGAAKNGTSQNVFDTIFPSLTPQIVGLKYGDMTFQPMVIESVSEPITNPRSEAGVMTACSVQITMSTLAALDRADMRRIYQ